jgi:hypothetical protein
VAESLIAGPQYRSSGTIRLTVRPDGFAAVAIAAAVRGTDLVLADDTIPLSGTMAAIASMAGIDAGPPEGAYEVVDPLSPDVELTIDTHVAEWLYQIHYAGGQALERVLPESHPVLWPEHFDVATSADEVNYGVSAGDEHHPMPYAYVGPWTVPTGSFWNAPFGALYPLDRRDDVDGLTDRIADFFDCGRIQLRNDRNSR